MNTLALCLVGLLLAVIVWAVITGLCKYAGRRTTRTLYSDSYFSGDSWDGKDEISREKFEKIVSERMKK